MGDLASWTGCVAGVISFAAFIPYIHSTLRRKARPQRVTWCIWTVVGFLLASSYYASGARPTIWVAVSYFVGPLLIAFLSFKYGEGGWNGLDRICLAGAALSVFLWWISRSPELALVFNVLIDLMGALPTLRKAYLEPAGEDGTAWILFVTANALNLMAVDHWRFSIVLYPAYMFGISGVIAFLIFRSKIVGRRASGVT